jgi:hypothetical protein
MADSDPSPPRSAIYRLPPEQRQKLALDLLARADRSGDGRAAFRRKYPHAPQEMIDTATFHVYVDGPSAVIDFLAEAELAIRDPEHEIELAPTVELLYHVYNWLQFRELLPQGRSDMLELVKQLRTALDEEDPEFLEATLSELEDILQGTRTPPDFMVP